ncbi:Transcriptional regulator, LysR family [hydrothermal vent metagenome]|uniref:Transcriptional regulator, LysR family n=1 Tax=hydrothermal vent metagenome TaxID=652676 RepID=A0A3B0RSX8_9ZZZZ
MGQFEDMDAFVRIVEAGSISQAANQLGVVKSAVSRRLVELEGRLGVQLLNRTTRQSSLTGAGRSYYERSVRILSDVAEINATTSDAKVALNGTLKISAPLTFGLQHLTPAINEFAETHPELIIHMDFNDRRVDLIEEGYDLAIRIADLKDSSLVARKLAPIRMAVCASPDYITRKGLPETPEDLKNHDILFYASSDNGKWQFSTPNGRTRSITLPARIISNNGDFLKDAAIKGFGIVRSPTFIVWQELRAGKLQLLLDDYHFTGLHAYAVYPETRHLPLRVRRFIDFLKDRFDGEPYWDRDLMSK